STGALLHHPSRHARPRHFTSNRHAPGPGFTAIARKARADRDPASTSHTVTANSCIPIVAKACLNHANSLKSMALRQSHGKPAA
ncbi:MAG: hypothetical protein ACLP3Q_10840, partial [Streptosporangiaceae bacterium]